MGARIRLPMAFLVLATLLVSGCLTGTAGTCKNLAFTIQGADDLLPSPIEKKRIARGGKVDVQVFRIDKGGFLAPDPSQASWSGPPERVVIDASGELALARVTSSDEGIVSVCAWNGSSAILEGRAPGSVEVVFSTARSTDSFDFIVADVERVTLGHLAGRRLLADRFPAQAAFLAGGTARFQIARYAGDGGELEGFGVPGLVEIDPPGSAALEAQARDRHHLNVKFNAAGTVKLKPKNSGTLELAVVEAGSIAKLELENGNDQAGSPLRAGDGTLLFLRATLADGTLVLGTDGAAEVTTQTPETCRVRSASWLLGDGFYGVGTSAAGTCKLTAKLGPLSSETVLTVAPQ